MALCDIFHHSPLQERRLHELARALDTMDASRPGSSSALLWPGLICPLRCETDLECFGTGALFFTTRDSISSVSFSAARHGNAVPARVSRCCPSPLLSSLGRRLQSVSPWTPKASAPCVQHRCSQDCALISSSCRCLLFRHVQFLLCQGCVASPSVAP